MSASAVSFPLARYRHSRVKASEAEIAKALTGNWRDEHLFVLGLALATYDNIARHLGECDAKLQGPLSQLGTVPGRSGQDAARGQQDARRLRHAPNPGQLGRCRSHPHQRPGAGRGDEDSLGDRPQPEPLCQHQALLLMAEPVSGTKISGGKVLLAKTKQSAKRVRQALKMAAMSLSNSDSALGAFYRPLSGRMD